MQEEDKKCGVFFKIHPHFLQLLNTAVNVFFKYAHKCDTYIP